ncbi:nitroreductase family protein [bacterium endosymbiont of Bathymodiolus sp. 5 South]|jgi:nitroreductase/dihydropteridine reductase|uniref:nitroreductase family protein n=1 Tax=bacterium endosymbiont of Bathymodiolus sp. 5 South TaxID=1181670 RepID=UPI0010B77225|nr:nitroreductase family protein [bacterium endosymbiont of Bathymodiolus sp. 5 South]CAC9634693.1 Oxygen-insensitive NAD(P)H nitroreductase (EC 1.-.-.-) / Dihydropteridine reductase (EC 1.5.1.34) [uncultured Gammaproteobacteria bacterium]SHN90152.1 Oxygen-insensitive NAD(P)H nitroreductase / Dihydropteridine reductase [bacterium endosymbiont of Bathymodiolus sp. 5 South]SSC08854.1 Oxygen-insensitive NAD(P)H nitroreductase / Dihydropteridine reductase [bacterium endosymbiont of Bathymodiolus sp.
MTHQIIKDLNWRHSTKKYNANKKVSKEDLTIIYEAMRLSASSINSQPWRFVVIKSKTARMRMSQTFAHKFEFNEPHVGESSAIILFAHNPEYKRENYAEVVDKGIEDGRTKPENREEAFGSFFFAELNTDENGNTSPWTKAQLYLALGNTLHTLARLKIDSTPIEGLDIDLVNQEFKKELGGYQCEVALAIGYQHTQDYNAKLTKSRRSLESILFEI